MNLELGLFTYPYKYLSLKAAFADAKKFGYDFIELWGGRPHAFTYDLLDGDIDIVTELMNTYNIPVLVYTPEHNAYPYNYMLGSQRQWDISMDYFKHSLVAAKHLGALYMLISISHSGNISDNECKKRLYKSMEHLSKLAEDIGVKIIVEALTKYESNHCTILEDYSRLIFDIDSPFLLAMLDMAVPNTQNEDMSDYFSVFKDKLGHIHLVDNDTVSDAHLIPGEGNIDMRSFLKNVEKWGYSGRATIELVDRYIDDPSKYYEIAIKYVRELWLELFV